MTASKILNISIENSYGKPLIEVVPEFSDLIKHLLKTRDDVVEDKIQIIKEDKVLNLITRIVVQKSDDLILGYVLTFDDITSLIAAQKWCDSLMIAEFGVSRAFEYMLRISLLIALTSHTICTNNCY